ncbi:hypothetical protein ABID22_002202 [Pontibacter aydingkolensis]|uniref:Uncharacterized protein n=1 Tax=Pontibacter aydingkolensis TaxID=1911536 RepID=A0ABS7CVC5_9BACT|nr:hypothetical protein [Pontibacter aydingkolensis]MBW7467809.1 hypothetical protein [Pontibacter aydingkolensis]
MGRYNRDRLGSGYGDDYYDRYGDLNRDGHNRYYDFDRGDRYRDDRHLDRDRDRDSDNRLDPETRNKFEREYRARFENDNRYNSVYQDRDRFRNNYRDEDDRYSRYDDRRDWSGSRGYSNNDLEDQKRSSRERRSLGDRHQGYGMSNYDSASDRYTTRNSRGRNGMDYDQSYYSGGY